MYLNKPLDNVLYACHHYNVTWSRDVDGHVIIRLSIDDFL